MVEIRAIEEYEFRNIIQTYQFPLQRYVRGLILSTDEVEDIVQKTFIDFWAKVQFQSTSVSNIQALLFRIARNKSVDWIRKQRVKRLCLLQFAGYQQIESPYENLKQQDLETHLLMAYQKLSLRDREILTLIYSEGMSMNEAAQCMGIRTEALSSRLRRARNKLRGLLPDTFYQEWCANDETKRSERTV